eukprot:7324753-Prymnesium_polylepis.2
MPLRCARSLSSALGARCVVWAPDASLTRSRPSAVSVASGFSSRPCKRTWRQSTAGVSSPLSSISPRPACCCRARFTLGSAPAVRLADGAASVGESTINCSPAIRSCRGRLPPALRATGAPCRGGALSPQKT